MIPKIFSNKSDIVQYYLIEPLIGILSITFYLFNIFFGVSILTLVSFLKIFPFAWSQYCYQVIVKHLQYYWVKNNIWIQRIMIPTTKWKVHFRSNVARPLDMNSWYLLISNHQSWLDILVLQRVFNGRIPPIKFFLKSQLAWILPIVTWACWLLDFPFVRRYSFKQLMRNPNYAKRNFQVAQKLCERYQSFPTVIANFVEGRRFNTEIRDSQNSPYQHLLKPQAGGIAVCIKNLHKQLHKVLNVTIIYKSPQKNISLWNFLCGRLTQINIDVEGFVITPELIGDYEHNKIFRANLQQWLNDVWLKKDQLIDKKIRPL